MDEKILLALVAGASAIFGGLISSVIAPLIKHRLEQRTADVQRKREQIQRWRVMVLEVDKLSGPDMDVRTALQTHQEFLSLEPHLLPEVRRTAYARDYTVSAGVALPTALEAIKTDITRIERLWALAK